MNKSKRCHFSLLPSHFLFSSFTIHPSSFPLWRNAPSQVRGLAEEIKHFSILFSSFHHLWATGTSHLALPIGESLFGGDSQARCLSGAAIRRSHLHPA